MPSFKHTDMSEWGNEEEALFYNLVLSRSVHTWTVDQQGQRRREQKKKEKRELLYGRQLYSSAPNLCKSGMPTRSTYLIICQKVMKV